MQALDDEHFIHRIVMLPSDFHADAKFGGIMLQCTQNGGP